MYFLFNLSLSNYLSQTVTLWCCCHSFTENKVIQQFFCYRSIGNNLLLIRPMRKTLFDVFVQIKNPVTIKNNNPSVEVINGRNGERKLMRAHLRALSDSFHKQLFAVTLENSCYRNFAKLCGKYLWRLSFLIKWKGLYCNFTIRWLNYKFVKSIRGVNFQEASRWPRLPVWQYVLRSYNISKNEMECKFFKI